MDGCGLWLGVGVGVGVRVRACWWVGFTIASFSGPESSGQICDPSLKPQVATCSFIFACQLPSNEYSQRADP